MTLVLGDLYFCKKAKEFGYKIYVDPTCQNKHLGSLEVDIDTWKNYNKEN